MLARGTGSFKPSPRTRIASNYRECEHDVKKTLRRGHYYLPVQQILCNEFGLVFPECWQQSNQAVLRLQSCLIMYCIIPSKTRDRLIRDPSIPTLHEYVRTEKFYAPFKVLSNTITCTCACVPG